MARCRPAGRRLGSGRAVSRRVTTARLLEITREGLYKFPAAWPSGKARACKALITGSNPVAASIWVL